MRVARIAAAGVLVAVGVRLAHSRDKRSLHPDGRSFTGELEVWGSPAPVGADLVDHPGRYPVTVRLSKGFGTRPGRRDVLGLAVRVHAPGRDRDLLFSTAGTGRWTRYVPVPRRDFDTWYGTITSYRTGDRRKVYLAAGPDPGGEALGSTLESVVAAARGTRARLLLHALHDGGTAPFGRVSFGTPLPAEADRELAFDAIRNASESLHPSGTVHGLRAAAYRMSQRWRGVPPPPPNPAGVTRTAAHR